MGNDMEIVIYGIGSAGILRLDYLSNMLSFPARYVAIGTDDTSTNGSISAEKRIKISKRLTAADAVERILSKLRTASKKCRLCFVVADVDFRDEKTMAIIPEIAAKLADFGVLSVGVLTTPIAKEGRKVHNRARGLVDWIGNHIGVIDIHKDNIPKEQTENAVILKTIEQIVRMVHYSYMGKDAVENVLSCPGRIHLMDQTLQSRNWKGNRPFNLCRYREREVNTLVDSSMLETNLSAATGALVHLTISSRLQFADLKYICEHLSEWIGIDGYFDCSIEIEESMQERIRVQIFAANTFTHEDWDEMFYS